MVIYGYIPMMKFTMMKSSESYHKKSGPSRIAEAQHHQFHKNHGDHVEQPQRQMVSHDSQGFLEPIDFCNFL